MVCIKRNYIYYSCLIVFCLYYLSLTVFKNKLLTKVDAPKNRLAHENRCIKRPSQLRRFHSISLDFFSLVNALVYVEHRPGHSLGKKSDEDLQCFPWSWLDDFIQPFSWLSLLVRALDFLNKLFLLGVA